MASKRHNRAGFFRKRISRWRRMSSERRHRRLMLAFKGACLLAVSVGAGYGLLRLERSVLASPQFNGPAQIRLVDAPPDLSEELMASLERFVEVPWSSPTLTGEIAATLGQVAWVKEVVRVRRYRDGVVEVDCSYRDPAAMVQMGGGFYLVDEECVRLPGRYRYDPSFKLVQGVQGQAPEPGRAWESPDLRAGLEVARLLAAEAFAGQVVAVLVQNYGGRVDNRAAHLELATDRPGRRIIWGSAPGEELEENTVAQKIAILRANYDRFGHIGAHREVIDISILPDRIHSPA